MKLKKIHIKNYKAFKDATFELNDGLNVIIGENGVGKSTLFEVIALARELGRFNTLNFPLVINKLGGYEALVSKDCNETISFKFLFILDELNKPKELEHKFIYNVSIGKRTGDVFFEYLNDIQESLNAADANKTSNKNQNDDFYLGQSYSYDIQKTKYAELYEKETINYLSNLVLSIPNVVYLHKLAEYNATLEDLETGNNLASFIYQETKNNPEKLELLREKVRKFIPEIRSFETVKTEDDRVLLKINSAKFIDPFYSKVLSDGTLKLFYYIILLNREEAPPLLCIEEPETYLYQGILYDLAEEFRGYTERTGKQVIITTHSPEFVDALYLDELSWIEKKDGESKFFKAEDDEMITYLNKKEGDQLGYLWRNRNILHPKK